MPEPPSASGVVLGLLLLLGVVVALRPPTRPSRCFVGVDGFGLGSGGGDAAPFKSSTSWRPRFEDAVAALSWRDSGGLIGDGAGENSRG